MPLKTTNNPASQKGGQGDRTLSQALVFNTGNEVTLADQALSLVSDKAALKEFVREHGCIHCLPAHLKRKFSDKASLYIFKDGTSLLSDPKSKHKAFSKNEEETLSFLKAKPSKNEMFFKMMQLKSFKQKIARKKAIKRSHSSFDY